MVQCVKFQPATRAVLFARPGEGSPRREPMERGYMGGNDGPPPPRDNPRRPDYLGPPRNMMAGPMGPGRGSVDQSLVLFSVVFSVSILSSSSESAK